MDGKRLVELPGTQDNTEDREAGWQSEDSGACTEFLPCREIVLKQILPQLLLHMPMSVQAKIHTGGSFCEDYISLHKVMLPKNPQNYFSQQNISKRGKQTAI